MREKFVLLLAFSILLLIPFSQAEAGSNANLSVSAENSKFNNYFSGSMVVEVVIRDSSINDTDEGKGEPDVTINGKSLRMVQATDGNWYAYFANVDKAKAADSTVGKEGEGLDFGVFCGRDTTSLGIDLSETDGVAVPRYVGLTGFTNGEVSFSSCTNVPSDPNVNNVVRNPKSINTNPSIPSGQIGLHPNAWPLIQLYSFDDVVIKYNPGGGVQQVNLNYDEIPNILLELDRDSFPQNSEVFVTINDIQLNQDPTDEDSWTFNIASPVSVFYQAFDSSGSNAANGDVGLVDLKPRLSDLGFEDNGFLSIDLGNVMELKSNSEQPFTSVGDGTKTFSQILTLVEEGPYSGTFDNGDDNDQSTTRILNNAPRGETGRIDYNDQSTSVLTGFDSAVVSLKDEPVLTIGDGIASLQPGTEFPVLLVDADQNINSGARDDLDVFRDTSIIPTLKIGNPITLENSFDVQFYTNSGDTVGTDSNSSVPDRNSDRLIVDTSNVPNGKFEKVSVNLGISASNLQSILVDPSDPNSLGTNWLNFDLQSFANDFGVTDFSDTSVELSFGSLGSSPVIIVDPGQLSSNGFIQLDDLDAQGIFSKSGSVFITFDFDSSNDNVGVGTISNEVNKQPIVFDFFSFGLVDNNDVNNSIYRFELEETSDNSSNFAGTFEYAVTNQLNILDPNFIGTIRTIDDEIKFIVVDRLVDEEGVSINYSDLDEVGVVITTSTKSDINTNSGTVSLDSPSYRFGQTVTFTLRDPDLNLKNDRIDTYQVIDNPASPNVDTVGNNNNVLLEILIKDIRYKRCTISGVEYGGLASTGFSLVETGTSTGVFKGLFKMPSQICDKSGSKLISSAGGSLDAKYYDARDASGKQNIFSLSSNNPSTQYPGQPELNQQELVLPSKGNIKNIILSGNIPDHRAGLPLTVTLIHPDGVSQNFSASLTNDGDYRAMFSIDEDSLTGLYAIRLFHNDADVGAVSFMVKHQSVPEEIKNNANRWSINVISDSEFVGGLEDLADQGIIKIPSTEPSSETLFPEWLKIPAKWWSNNEISDDEFLTAIEFLAKKGIIRI